MSEDDFRSYLKTQLLRLVNTASIRSIPSMVDNIVHRAKQISGEQVTKDEEMANFEEMQDLDVAESSGLTPGEGAVVLDRFDAGLLNHFGGGNVGWWYDYIRSLLERAHDHYELQAEAFAPRASAGDVGGEAMREACAKWHDEQAREERRVFQETTHRPSKSSALARAEMHSRSAAAIRALPTPRDGQAAEVGEAMQVLLRVAQAASLFCEELQEDGEGVPQPQLRDLHDALDAYDALPTPKEP